MVIVFKDFAVDATRLPDGGLELRYLEAMQGEGPDGQPGIVGTGNQFATVMDKETAIQHIIELAVTMGLMSDQDAPQVADLATMRAELDSRKQGKKGRPGR